MSLSKGMPINIEVKRDAFLRHLKEILQSLKYASTLRHGVIAVAFVTISQWDLLDVLSACLSFLWVGVMSVFAL